LGKSALKGVDGASEGVGGTDDGVDGVTGGGGWIAFDFLPYFNSNVCVSEQKVVIG